MMDTYSYSTGGDPDLVHHKLIDIGGIGEVHKVIALRFSERRLIGFRCLEQTIRCKCQVLK